MSFFYHKDKRKSVTSASVDHCGFVYNLIMKMVNSPYNSLMIGAYHA